RSEGPAPLALTVACLARKDKKYGHTYCTWRSYTLIVEAWDFNNETSGEYFFPSDIYVLPCFLFIVSWPSLWQHLGDIMLKVREGGLSFPNPTALFLKIHRKFF
ncbi:hypothetical protein XENOCAPTIV_030259, partial [Xenoophorus captivus]